jgi:RimJ/RimL family protein N-acetyltransferase
MLTIQKANRTHLDALVEFQQGLASETENLSLDNDTLRKGLSTLFDDPSKGVYFVVLDGDTPVGCHLITYEWSEWRNGMVWWMQSVYITKAYRQQGVFRMMFDNIMRIIDETPGLLGLRLYVDKSNEKAMRVYESLGMDGSHYTVYEKMK